LTDFHRSRRVTIVPYSRLGQLKSCAVVVAFTWGCGPADTLSAPAPEAEVAESNVIACNADASPEDREVYVLSAIRKKLRDYPDLALEWANPAPASCDEARAFRASYEQYSNDHPGFDADQPLGPPPEPLGEPDGSLPQLEIDKIQNGQTPLPELGAYPRSSVVRLTALAGPNSVPLGTCTGTFIAKNWIVTAAHCLSITRAQSIPSQNVVAGDLYGYARWKIDWADANGNPVGLATVAAIDEDILQHPDPRYTGIPTEFRFDFALLYLNHQRYDRILPTRTDVGAAMRIAREAPTSSQAFFIAGYGTTVAGAPENLRVLRSGAIGPVTFSDELILRSPGPNPEPTVCPGDSGGPLYTVENIPAVALPPEVVPSPPAPTRVPILQGVAKNILRGASDRCAGAGDTERWIPVYPERLFIEERMALWQNGPLFECRPGRPSGASSDTIAECWGQPCVTAKNCGSQYCSKPGTDFRTSECALCSGDCSCVIGQCLPGPPPPPPPRL
jgi:hypothetical protein